MYPLNMTSTAGGFALANSEDEHIALSAAGFVPAYAERLVVGGTAGFASASAAPQEPPVGDGVEKEPAAADPVSDAQGASEPEPTAKADPRADLRTKAEALGIDVDSRWGVKRLEEEIAKHG